MASDERRSEDGRRLKRDRRQNGSMISAYVNYSEVEHRSRIERRYPSDRRMVAD